MRQSVPYDETTLPRLASRLFLSLSVLSVLAACGSQQVTRHSTASHQYSPGRYYPPPGPANDPWGPYIHEASGRFGMPEQWIRAVMRQESGGQEDVISWAGAMGLMQVMPETYDSLRGRYDLGDDPFDPHNNILAGTAYLREMYDRYGSPAFLAAYNAGPNRLDHYLSGGMSLPDETVNYVASIAPRLGPGTPMSGPLAVYAGNYGASAGAPRIASASSSTGCDPDAAYNPDGPCTPLRPADVQPAVLQTAQARSPAPTPADCDPDAAYDPDRPCAPRAAPVAVAMTEPPMESAPAPAPASRSFVMAEPLEQPAPARAPSYASVPSYPSHPAPVFRQATSPLYASNEPASMPARTPLYHHARPIQETMAQPATYRPIVPPAYTPPPPAHWSIQVGAYASLAAAEAAADNARALLPDALRLTKTELLPTAPLGNHVAFRARIAGLTASAASEACSHLARRGLPCITVPPSKL